MRVESGQHQPVFDRRDGAGQCRDDREPPADEVGDVCRALGDVEHRYRQHLLKGILAVFTEPGQHNGVVVESALIEKPGDHIHHPDRRQIALCRGIDRRDPEMRCDAFDLRARAGSGPRCRSDLAGHRRGGVDVHHQNLHAGSRTLSKTSCPADQVCSTEPRNAMP